MSIPARGRDDAVVPPKNPMLVFDQRAWRRHRGRAAARDDAAEFLFVESAAQLVERLSEIKRDFTRALDLGSRGGILAPALAGKAGIEFLVAADPAEEFVRRTPAPRLVAEPEALPFAPHSFDLVLSNLLLHWTNDLPGALLQLRHALKPGGLLLAALFGGETLAELGGALLEAELAESGGAGPRVSPFADIRDLGALLQRAGFVDPVVDSDRLEVTYADTYALMRDLRAMGESNALAERRRGLTRRGTLADAARLYAERCGTAEGRVRADFQVLTLTAWAPAGL